MRKRKAHSTADPIYACRDHACRWVLAVLLMAALLASGCGTSNYSAKTDEEAVDTETTTEKDTVREHWQTALNIANQSVTYTPLTADDGPRVITGASDSISMDFSLVEGKDKRITCSGAIALAADASITEHPMVLSFKGFQVDLSAETITITGTEALMTMNVNGAVIQPACDLILTIRNNGNLFTCDAELTIADFDTRASFSTGIVRSSAAVLSFITNTWAKQGPGIVVHFPRKKYSEQEVLTGTAATTLMNLQLSDDVDDPRISGYLDIPSGLSVNGDALRINLTDAPAYINEPQHTFKFCQSGTLTTIDAEENAVDTAYSLSVTVSAENVTVYSPNPDYDPEKPEDGAQDLATGQKTRYTAKVTLVLDGLATRTTLITEIKRTDTGDNLAEPGELPVIPSLSGGAFVLEGNKTYSLTHAKGGGETEETVKTTADDVILDLAFTQAGDAVLANGSLTLSSPACPDNVPELVLELNDIPATAGEGSSRIDAPVRLKRKHSDLYSTYVDADLVLVISSQPNGDYLCDAALTTEDYETGFRFTTEASLSGGIFSLASDLTWPLALTLGDGEPTYTDVMDNDLTLGMILSPRVDQGVLSTKADGAFSLKLDAISPSPLDMVYHNASILVDEDGRTLRITGKWSYRNSPAGTDISSNDLTLLFTETGAGDRMFEIAFIIPGIGNEPDRTVRYNLPAEKVSGAMDLLAMLLDGE